MDIILTVQENDLKNFDPKKAVIFFSELLWAEANVLGIAKTLINVPRAIHVRDGGVDAEVRNVQISGGQGIIKSGLTCYQIKTGESKTSQDNLIKKVLFNEKTKTLKPKIESCLDQDGTLVIVLFEYDNPGQTDEQLHKKFKAALTKFDSRYQQSKIEVWRQNRLISFLQPYPALALKANGREKARFELHEQWANNADMRYDPRKTYISGEEQQALISRIQEELRRSDNAPVHIQIHSEPGIGKTRLVLEATDTNDLRPLVIYCTADEFHHSDLMTILLRGEFHAILVLDECDQTTRKEIWNKLKCKSPRIKIISIHDERVENEYIEEVTPIKVLPLQEQHISAIIQKYSVSEELADRWAKECEGSPKVAHIVGKCLIANPSKIPDSLKEVWEDYIAGSSDKKNGEVAQRRKVLQYLSLFKRFGYEPPVENEARALAGMIQQENPLITWGKFQEIIHYLRKHGILQGKHTLHISPKLLHVTFWSEWWEVYGEHFSFDMFQVLPDSLRDWAIEMFQYAKGSENATHFLKNVIEKNRNFQASHSSFIRFLADAEPQWALHYFKETIGRQSKEELLRFMIGRRGVIDALQKIARWKNLFVDAARLLLALGEAENEEYTNNASGVFTDLFYISPHPQLSKTEASPQERFPILQEAFESSSKERRRLALQVCDRALRRNYEGGIPQVSPIFEKEFTPWIPKTCGEFFDAYRQVWQYIFHKLDVTTQALFPDKI